MNLMGRIALFVFLLINGYDCMGQEEPPNLDVPYEPTHPKVVEAMLELAQVTEDDLLYDLGCGDGRILIIGAKKYGVHGVGVDLDPQRLKEARESATISGVPEKVRFFLGDIFDFNFSQASVLTLYLLDEILLQLRPILFQQLRPGSRVVSHAFDMGIWEPDSVVYHPKARREEILMWVIPASIGGEWTWTTQVSRKDVHWNLLVSQTFQAALYTLVAPTPLVTDISRIGLRGRHLSFVGKCSIRGKSVEVLYQGIARGDTIVGTQEWHKGPISRTLPWEAIRVPVDVLGAWNAKVRGSENHTSFQLKIKRGNNGLRVADYISGKTSLSKVPVYAWGASIWFEVEDRIYKGFVSGDSIIGNLKAESFEGTFTWSAERSN